MKRFVLKGRCATA